MLPDDQFVHVIIESYYEAEVMSFRVTRFYFDQKRLKMAAMTQILFQTFRKNEAVYELILLYSILNIDTTMQYIEYCVHPISGIEVIRVTMC